MTKRFLTLVFVLLFLSAYSFAQKNIQGKVLDKKDEGAVEIATLRLLNAKDSTFIQSCQTDDKGEFTFNRVKEGAYILEVRFLGYNTYFRNVEMADKSVLLKNIYLEGSDNVLKEIQVTGMAAQMAVRNDTVEYNSAAFKMPENSAIEELLKKLPGVVVDADGKITINGEEIKKIRVDGKKFFGGDILMATKNMPVDMIDKIQVIDQKSEMAQLTGFEDENTEKIINLTIKPNKKKGIFGNMTAGGGMDMDKEFRYNDNVFLNVLNGNSQSAITAGANNSNRQRSGRGRTGMTGGSGITETQNLGFNNNTEVTPMLKIGGNATYNHSANTVETSSERESWLKGVTYNNFNESASKRDNQDGDMRFEMEWKIDSLSTLIVQPEVQYSKGFSNSASKYEYYADGDSISWGSSKHSSESSDAGANINLIFSHKSKTKKGRTFTINLGGDLSSSESEGHNKSDKMTLDTTVIVDQRTVNNSSSKNANMRISYVEPLFNLKNFLEIAATARARTRNSEKMQYKKNVDGIYNVLDSVYSNNYVNNFYNEALELNFRHQEPTYNYMIGAKAEPSQTYSTTFYKNGEILDRVNEVMNFSPTASFRYNFGKRHFARLEYRGRTSQPSIEDMQPVKNNNNLMNETIGNPSLNPSFEHSLRLMYSSFNPEHLSSFSAGLNGAYTKDALVSNSIYDKTGKRFTQTVNSEYAPFNASANIMFNTPIIKNRLQFNTSSQVNYQQRFGYSDRDKTVEAFDENGDLRLGKLSKTQNKGASQNISLTFTTDLIEIGARGSVRYSNTSNNLNNKKSQETKDWTGSGNIDLHLPFNMNISNNFSYTKRQGYSSFDKDELVWNASIDKTLFRKKGTISLNFYDILQQKLTVSESIGDNFRQLNKYNALTSYVMLSFTYKLTRFGGGIRHSDMRKNFD